MVKAIPMEDWLRGCIYHDGRQGYVTLPIDKVHQIANYIQRTRRSGMDGLIDLEVVEADRKTEPTTKTETQNSNLTFEKRTMRDCYNCKRYETEGECIECHYEPKDEPQTCSVNGRPYSKCGSCEHFKCTADEPQTEREGK